MLLNIIDKIMNKLRFPNTLRQFFKFCTVGVLGAAFNYSIFLLLYVVFGVYYVVSSATGFVLAMFLAFLLNKRFTFRIHGGKTFNMLTKYFIISIFSLILGMFFLIIFVEVLKINVYIANLLIAVITGVSNFTGSKLFAFVEKGKNKNEDLSIIDVC